jgi:DNA-binding response OmpR family regulator
VVDDDQALLRTIRLTLVTAGYAVETASNGALALQQLEDQRFDLVVLDLQMPGLDGRGVVLEMRKRNLTTPVLILSAYGAEAAAAELRVASAVAKPFDVDDLVEEIRKLL